MINRILLWLSLALIFSIPWEDMISLPVIGSMARLAGMVVFAAWAGKTLLTGRLRKPQLFHGLVYFFLMWTILGLFWTYGFAETKARVITYSQLLLMTLIFWDTYRTPGALNAALQAYVFGAWVGVGNMLMNFLSGVRIDAYEVGRYSASGVNAGDFVILLTLALPMAWYLARFARGYTRSRALRVINYAYVPVAGSVVFLTGSRLSLFVIIPALLYVFGTLIQPRRILTSMLMLIALTGALLIFQSFIPEATWARLTSAGSSISSGDLGGRVPLWKESLKAFAEHPITGVGSGAFRVVNPYKAVAHNTYLSVLAEQGLVGFGLFAAILAVVFLAAMQHPRREQLFWVTTLAVLLVGITVQTWEFTKTTFLIFSLVVIGANVTEPQAAEAAPAPAVPARQTAEGRLGV